MAGIFKDRGDDANVGMFSSTELDLKGLESAWSPGEGQADPSVDPQPTTGTSDPSNLFQDISKRTDEELNVGMFGAAGENVGAFQSAWDSAKIAEEAVKRVEDAAKKVADAEAIANSIASTKKFVDSAEKSIDTDVKSFNTKLDKLNQETLPSIVRSTLDVQTSERDINIVKQEIENIKTELQQKLLEALTAERNAASSEHSTEALADTVRITKDKFDRASQELIDNFLNYRGLWDPTIDAYPLPEGGDSVWDINLPDGFTTYTFDGKSWAEGDRLFWYKNNPVGKKWVHLKSGSGLIVTNLDNLYQKLDNKNIPNGYAGLDSNGKVLSTLMPALSILDINVDHNFYERNSRTNLQKGDISIIKGAVIWKDSFPYKQGDIVYTPDPTHPHSVASNRFYAAKRDFNSGLTFDASNWVVTTLAPNTLYKLGKEVVYKNKLYLLKQDYTSGRSVVDPSKLPKYFEHDNYIDSGMYILQRDPTGKAGSSTDDDWISFGSDFRVSSFNGRVGTVLPQVGDYDANDVTTKAYGSSVATNVQDFLEGLESRKVSKSGDKISGKLIVKDDISANNIQLTGLGEEKLTNANNNPLIRSGGNGDATVLGNLIETTTIESKSDPEVIIGVNSKPSKLYHEGFIPTATDVGARDDRWVPDWNDVQRKPETATRWPFWSEVQNPPALFSGSYLSLTDVPTEFNPRSHTHTWSQILNKPVQTTRWPSWSEVTNKPSGIVNQPAYDGRYLLKGAKAVDSALFDGKTINDFGQVFKKTDSVLNKRWYTFAKGDDQCNGEFAIVDKSFSRYGFVKFQAGINHNKLPYINVTSSGGYADGNGILKQLRIVSLDGSNKGLEVYVDSSGSIEVYMLKSGYEGWSLIDIVEGVSTKVAKVQVDLDLTTGFQSSDHIYANGGKVYSSTNKPTANDVGAYTKAETDGKYFLKGDTSVNSLKLENKTVAQIVTQARAGLVTSGTAFTKAEADGRYLKLTGGTLSGGLQVKTLTVGDKTDPVVGVNFNGHATQTGELYATNVDTNSVGGNYSFHFKSTEAETNVIIDKSGGFFEGTTRVYSPNNKPTAADIGALTQTLGDGRYLKKGAKAVDSDKLDGISSAGFVRNNYLEQRISTDANTNDSNGVDFKYLNGGAANKPTGTDHALMSMSFSNAWATQMASDWRTNRWYVRNQNNSNWGSWAELFSTVNKPTLTDVGLGNLSITPNKTVKIQSKYGYLTLGPENTSHMHFGTDRSNFYFNKMLRVDGDVQLYSHSNTKLNASNGHIEELGQRVYSPNNKPTVSDVLTATTISKSLALSANSWTTLLEKSDGLTSSGVYIISVSYNSAGASGGTAYSETYSGQFSWFAGGTNQVDACEIPLTNMGHADSEEFIYLRTLTKLGNKGDQEVQILCNKSIPKSTTFTVKLVKLM